MFLDETDLNHREDGREKQLWFFNPPEKLLAALIAPSFVGVPNIEPVKEYQSYHSTRPHLLKVYNKKTADIGEYCDHCQEEVNELWLCHSIRYLKETENGCKMSIIEVDLCNGCATYLAQDILVSVEEEKNSTEEEKNNE